MGAGVFEKISILKKDRNQVQVGEEVDTGGLRDTRNQAAKTNRIAPLIGGMVQEQAK